MNQLRKRVVIRFDEVDENKSIIKATINKMVGEDINNPNVRFVESYEDEDEYLDMYKGDTLVALISVFKYNDRRCYVIDYKEVERFIPNGVINIDFKTAAETNELWK